MPQVKLNITRETSGRYLVVVNGREFFNAPVNASVGVRIRGDDTFFDDTLFGMSGRLLPDGSFTLSRSVTGGTLNEDWGEDEVYAAVKVQGFGEMNSNTIRGHF